MASRPILAPYQIVGGTEPGAVSGDMSTTITSPVTVIQTYSMVSYDISWSGTSCAGTISVQASNSYSKNADGSVANAGTWTTLPLSVTPTVSTDTGSGFIDIDSSAGYAVRLVYTPSAGAGTMAVTVCGKVQ